MTVNLTFERLAVWQRPTYQAIYAFLTNPLYAGVYAYGKKEWQTDAISQRKQLCRRPRHQWYAFIPEHHPGYITLAEYEENQRILANNRNCYPESQGAPRAGAALLPGLVYCGHCGRRMYTRYSNGRSYYICDHDYKSYGDDVCQQVNATHVGELVADRFLTVVNEGSLELSMAYEERLSQEVSQIEQGWQEKLQRLTFVANRARRRYEMVDPANRLVAQTLETEWNTALVHLEEAQQEFEACQRQEFEQKSTVAQMRQAITNLRSHWEHEQIRPQDRKALLRCLIESVFLHQHGKLIQVRLYWQGGAMSAMEVPKRLLSQTLIYCRIKELALTHTDKEIAQTLNEAGLTSVMGKLWQAHRVYQFWSLHPIPSSFSQQPALRVQDSGYLTVAEVAVKLAVKCSLVRYWCLVGVLTGKTTGSFWWIRWQDEFEEQLKGDAPLLPTMIAVRLLCKRLKQQPKEIFAWARAEGYDIYRLHRGKAMKFYILLPDDIMNQLHLRRSVR